MQLEVKACLLKQALLVIDFNTIGYASSCGSIQDISYPFRLEGDPQHCGHHKYELSCENNRTIVQLISGGRYYVEEINYTDLSMRVVDPGVQKDNCSSLPLYSLTRSNFSDRDPYQLGRRSFPITFISCATPVNSTRYIDTALVCNHENNTCLNSSPETTGSRMQRHTYVVYGMMRASDVKDSCRIEIQSWVLWYWYWYPNTSFIDNISFRSIPDQLVYGFSLSWYRSFNQVHDFGVFGSICFPYPRWCPRYQGDFDSFETKYLKSGPRYDMMKYSILGYSLYGSFLISLVIAARIPCGCPCVFAFLVYKWRRRHLSMYNSIEEFIQSHNNLMPATPQNRNLEIRDVTLRYN